jgi:hypothetical protein
VRPATVDRRRAQDTRSATQPGTRGGVGP